MPTSKRFLYRTVLPTLFTSSLLVAFRLSSGAAAFVWDANPSVGADGPQDGPGTWQTGAGNWFDSTNNLQNQNWANGNDAIFGAGTGAAGIVSLGGPITANSLTFNAAGSGNYAINGNTLTLTTGNITSNTASTVNSTISSIIAGNAGLTISGTGTVVLNGSSANTYTGKTTVSSGSLTLNKAAGVAAVTGDIEVDAGGTLNLAADNQIPDTATVTVLGGTVNFGGKNETIQNLTLTGGSFATGNGTNITSTVNVTGTVAISGGGAFTINSGATLNVQSLTLTDASPVGGATLGASILLGGNIDTRLVIGSGGLSMSGQTITLNTGAGNTAIVLNGDLTASGTNVIKLGSTPGTGTNTLAIGTANRTLNITGGTTSINVTIAGSSGSLIKAGAGNLVFGGSTANTYSGLVTVNAGTLTLSKTAGVTSLAGDALVNGGTLVLGSSNQIADTSSITVTAGTFSGGSGVSDTFANLLLNGGNFSSLTSNITISGTTTITGGLSTAFTVNSGGTVTTNGMTLTGGGILMGGSSATLTTLTIGSGGLSLTGETIQLNAATAGMAGEQIILNGDVSARGTNNFTLNGTVPNGAVAQLVIGSATRTFNIGEGTTSMGIPIVGAGGTLVKQGAGILALSADNTYDGATIVNSGTLAVSLLGSSQGKLSGTTSVVVSGGIFQDGSSISGNNNGINDRINPLATLTLGGSNGGGTFNQAFSTSTSSQTLASLAVQAGASKIGTINAAAGTLSLTFTGTGGAGYTRSVGGSVNITTAAGYTAGFTNAPTAAGGSSVAGTDTDAVLIGATLNGADFITAKAGALTAATYVDTGTATWSAGKNMNVTGNVTATAGTPINSLRFNTLGAFTATLAGTQTIDSGMILVGSTVGNNLSRISGGTLIGSAGGDLLILQYNTANGLTISSTIADNAGATGLTIAGGGLVTLTGNNTYTGQTYLNGGTLSIASNSALGSAATGAQLNIDGGTLLATTTFALDNAGANRRNVVLNAGGGTFNINSGATLTVDGNVSGNGSLTKSGTGALLLSGTNTYKGNTAVGAGTLEVTGATSGIQAVTVATGATLQLAGSGAISANTLSLANNSTLSLEVGTLTANTISLTGAATLTGSITLALNLTADPLDGTFFTLIDGASPLIGYSGGARFTFDGQTLNEGTIFHVTTGGIGQDFQISYVGGSDGDNVTLQAVPAVPEPSALFALGSGIGLLGLKRLRRRAGLLVS